MVTMAPADAYQERGTNETRVGPTRLPKFCTVRNLLGWRTPKQVNARPHGTKNRAEAPSADGAAVCSVGRLEPYPGWHSSAIPGLAGKARTVQSPTSPRAAPIP